MKQPKFKIGDIVKLKSDSPKVTIIKINKAMELGGGPDQFNGSYMCAWFNGDINYTEGYPEEALELAD